MTHGKTYNKSPRRINHKATKSKTNTGTTALERSVEQTTGGVGGGLKQVLSLASHKWGIDKQCRPRSTLFTLCSDISIKHDNNKN